MLQKNKTLHPKTIGLIIERYCDNHNVSWKLPEKELIAIFGQYNEELTMSQISGILSTAIDSNDKSLKIIMESCEIYKGD